ncbi:DUF4350 domain-containing protein [Candidatus Bathyarchaeota archaeon]|nr:MAG: DUF4350 domain-containing protein [Candidatus Bathyarchaeota archaeon]
MKKTSLSIILGVAFSILVLVGVTTAYPNIDDLWVENPFWNGLSTFYTDYQPIRMNEFSELDALYNPRNSTLFIIGPYKELTTSELTHLIGYLGRGGTLVLSDDFGTGNNILESLEVEVRFDQRLLRDPVFREKNSYMPRATANLAGIGYIVLNYPTVLTGVDSSIVSVWSSPLSYVSDNDEISPSLFASYPVMTSVSVSGGRLIVLSDSSVFINSMLDKGENKDLLDYLARGTVVIDEAHSAQSRLSIVKSFLAKTIDALGVYEIRYSLLFVILLGVSRLSLTGEETPVDPVEELMKRHPEYDRKQLEWLQAERKAQRK